MNVKIAKETYTKVKRDTSSNDKINHGNVGLALRKLRSNMVNMTQIDLMQIEEQENFKKSYRTALYAIYFLQKSLDFDKGGELASNLFRLYEFCKFTVQEVVISHQPEKSNLEACIRYIGEIIDSWEKIYN